MRTLFKKILKKGPSFYPAASLFLLATSVRLIYFYFFKQEEILWIPILDAEYYLEWAQKIAAGDVIGRYIFFTEPLYAYFLAFITKLSSLHVQTITIFIQFILGSLLTVIVYFLTNTLFKKSVAVIAGVSTAIYGPFIFYESLLLKTGFEVFGLALFGLVFLSSLKVRKNWLFGLSGVLLGITVLIKGNSILFLPVILLYLLHEAIFLNKKTASIKYQSFKNKLLPVALFGVGFFLMVAPLTLRNYLVEKDLVMTNYSFGMNVYQGNWWDADGSLLQPPFMRAHPDFEEMDSYKMAEAYSEKELKPSEVSSFWLKKTWSEVSENPAHVIRLLAKKVILFITPVEMSDNYSYSFYQKKIPLLNVLPDFFLIAPLSLFGIATGLWQLKQNKKSIKDVESLQEKKYVSLVLLLVGTYFLSVVIGHVNSRYRMAVIPYHIVFASYAAWTIFQYCKQKSYLKLEASLLAVLILFMVCGIKLDNFAFMNDANFYNNVGSYYMDNGKYFKAQMYFEKAKQSDPSNSWVYGNLFDLYLRTGEFVLARENLQDKIRLRPDDLSGYTSLSTYRELKDKPLETIWQKLDISKNNTSPSLSTYDPYFIEYMRYMKYGEAKKAELMLEKSAEKFANPENTLVNLAALNKASKNIPKAKELLEMAIRKNPDFLAAKYNLANIYIAEKNASKSSQLLQEVYDEVPEFGETWYALPLQYLQLGEEDKALPLVVGYIERYKNDISKSKKVKYFQSIITEDTK